MNQSATMHVGNAGRDKARTGAVQRWGAVLGGSALAIYGLTRRSPVGIAMAATGGALAFLGARPNVLRRDSQARSNVLLSCSAEQAYQFWHNFENLPRFMNHVESVTVSGERRSRWTAIGPLGNPVKWEAETDADRPNEFISWHSLPGSDVQVNGSVSFRPATGNRGTIVEAIVEYRPPAGVLGASAAKILGKDPKFLMQQDLRRLKALIETGEIPTVDGQTHGPRSATTAVSRMMDPDRPIRRGAKLSEVFEAQRRIS